MPLALGMRAISGQCRLGQGVPVRSVSTSFSTLIRHHNNAAFNMENVMAMAGAPNNRGNKAISTTTNA